MLEAFEASVLRLLDMERSGKSYHGTEWRRQIATCKHETLRVLRQAGIRMDSGFVEYGPRIWRVKNCSIVVDWRPCKWKLGRVRLTAVWYPNPKSICGEPQHVTVLSKPLTDADMEVAGWTYFEGWHTDYGYDGEWIPVGAPDSDGRQ